MKTKKFKILLDYTQVCLERHCCPVNHAIDFSRSLPLRGNAYQTETIAIQ